MPGGRPDEYTEAVGILICDRMAAGESLRSILDDDPNLPTRTTVRNWLGRHAEFLTRYEKARESRADHMFDEIIDIADNGQNDWMERNDKDNAGYEFKGEHVNRSRLRVDTRKWILARMDPNKYGDKVEQRGPVGADGLPLQPPVQRLVIEGGLEMRQLPHMPKPEEDDA